MSSGGDDWLPGRDPARGGEPYGDADFDDLGEEFGTGPGARPAWEAGTRAAPDGFAWEDDADEGPWSRRPPAGGWHGPAYPDGGYGAAGDGYDAARDGYRATGEWQAADEPGYGRPGGPGERSRPPAGRDHAGDMGSSRWADSGSFRWEGPGAGGGPDSGSSRWADSGSFRWEGPGAGGGPDSGSFRRADSGSFRWEDPGAHDGGAWARPVLQPEPGTPPNGAGRHARWQEEPRSPGGWPGDGDLGDDADAGWHDDELADDSGLIGRRFGGRDGSAGGRSGHRRGRGRRPRRLRGRLAFLAAVLVGVLMLGFGAEYGYQFVHGWIMNRYGDYPGQGTGTVRITVQPGEALISLGPALARAGVIMAVRPFDSAANAAQNASTLQPGVYILHYHMNAAIAVQWLLSGKHRLANTFTVIPGERASQVVAGLAKRTGLPAAQFMRLIRHPAALGLPPWGEKTAEGFLYPDTYTLAPHMPALSILKMMVTDFTTRTAGLHLPAAAAKVFTTPYHVLIVASMVQAEAGSVGDFGKIARVAWNRLKLGMHLDFDSTVFYGLNKYGTSATDAELKINTPYNTYMHAGLPPGPIGSPSLAAIEAALHPARGTWIYFITDLRSTPHKTYFTASYAQFRQWQQEFQG